MSDFNIDFKDPTTWLLAPLLAPLLPLALLSGCEEDGASSSGCTEGETQSCMCPGETATGVQACEDDGTWGECDCGSTDTDTDTECSQFTDMQNIAAGDEHTCALLDSGGVKCWGNNGSGQLGDGNGGWGDDKYETTPVDVVGLTSGVETIAAGDSHTCAVLTSGGVKCWGSISHGQLGNGISDTFAFETSPVDVLGLSSGVQDIAAGKRHTCAVLDSGGVMCWGSNEYGQLGDGTEGDSSTPVDVSGLSSGVQAIAAGAHHTCALLDSGGAMCWGHNEYGQLGNGISGEDEHETTPVDVSGLSSGMQDIATGSAYTCALLTSGGMKCWGSNKYGQLGDGTTVSSTTPIDVSGLSSGVEEIAAGGWHICALLDSGGMQCWGGNSHGKLGDGSTEKSSTPVDVSGLSTGVQDITAGGSHTCAVLQSGGAMCWGYNEHGQLGNGISGEDEYEATPVDVCSDL